jgi:hypothetical protein
MRIDAAQYPAMRRTKSATTRRGATVQNSRARRMQISALCRERTVNGGVFA